MITEIDIPKVINDYRKANSRLVLLDYDGTLVPFDLHPNLTKPSLNAKTILHQMALDSKNSVVLISGRDKENLEAYWADLNIVLAAEHGGFFKRPGENWATLSPYMSSFEWLNKVSSALHALSFQYEGSFVEKKHFSVAWHYRAIADRVTDADVRQILAALRSLPLQEDFLISNSEYTIELRARGIDKGSAVARWAGNQYFDFIMAIGDSQTDEDMFKIFGSTAYTIRVGKTTNTAANYFIRSQSEVLPFLNGLIGVNPQMLSEALSLSTSNSN
ncbi:MAG: trehalose-phosphatase [Cyclobacteriaceae bacterium]|nr:trehalose-phosphatase [Cyclobacteriaceae bacterium]